jgi:cbb3-type cytochrome c oxidase subunit III
MNRFLIFAAAISCICTGNTALSAGSAQAGATKSAVCQACHGATGNSANPEWPSLAGLGGDYIVEQLQNFKDGKRANAIMQGMAAALSTQDMQDVAAYFDAQVNTGGEADPAHRQAGEKLFRGGDKTHGIPACMACHGPNGAGNGPAKFPALRGQHSVYVTEQLTAYAAGTRPPGPGGIMPAIAKRLSADDIRDLSSYVQGLR